MAITIDTAADETKFAAYMAARDATRQAMANAAIPGLRLALQKYAELAALVAASDVEMQKYHTTVSAPVADHIATLIQASQLLISTVEAIEVAAPGTFGITVSATPPVPEVP